jgi:DNA-binding PadR family transcriptional regulator
MEPKRVVVDLQQLDLLEQKIVKATELIRSLRREKDAALAKTRDLEKALAAAQSQIQATEKGREELRELSEQIDLLREERQEIRGRVNQMLEMMSGLEEGAEARREH